MIIKHFHTLQFRNTLWFADTKPYYQTFDLQHSVSKNMITSLRNSKFLLYDKEFKTRKEKKKICYCYCVEDVAYVLTTLDMSR